MKLLHAILVEVDDTSDLRAAEEAARREAMLETEFAEKKAFEWRTKDNAGRWKEEWPGRGVLLGAAEPERLVALVEEWARKPLEAALQVATRALEEGPLVINEEFVRRAWEAMRQKDSWELWCELSYLKRMLEMLLGGYLFDSQFYSVPDESTILKEETLQEVRKAPERFALVFTECESPDELFP